ncbi:MAG: hypothetical protein O2780_06415 [Proteobacteria bacterium]|jgi:hypothetical protein|nr:hypothetical protein [Pseudomonadota bacterium]MDA1301866.1 hypothetical protein [Pseudomonadota bacterium]
MNHERLKRIIEAYGARQENWPANERGQAVDLLAADEQAQRTLAGYLAQQRSVDEALDALTVMPGADLRDRILQALPRLHWVDRCLAWLLPDTDQLRQYFWRPVLAASLPLVTGLLLGASTLTTDTSFSWEDELTLMALDDSVMEILSE